MLGLTYDVDDRVAQVFGLTTIFRCWRVDPCQLIKVVLGTSQAKRFHLCANVPDAVEFAESVATAESSVGAIPAERGHVGRQRTVVDTVL